MNKSQKLVDSIIKGIQDKKGSGIVVADLTQTDGAVCSYFIICHRLRGCDGSYLPSRGEGVLRPGASMGGCKADENPGSGLKTDNFIFSKS